MAFSGRKPPSVPVPGVTASISSGGAAVVGLDTSAGPRGEGTSTVLVVDDEPAVRTLVARILEQEDYSVILAGSGEAALEALETHSDEIDVLLTDVIMPKMLGTDLALQVHAAHPDMAVVLMSAYSRDELESQGKLTSDVALVEKPFEFYDLLAAVSAALQRRLPQRPGTALRRTARPTGRGARTAAT